MKHPAISSDLDGTLLDIPPSQILLVPGRVDAKPFHRPAVPIGFLSTARDQAKKAGPLPVPPGHRRFTLFQQTVDKQKTLC
jgi:hypothetical protein